MRRLWLWRSVLLFVPLLMMPAAMALSQAQAQAPAPAPKLALASSPAPSVAAAAPPPHNATKPTKGAPPPSPPLSPAPAHEAPPAPAPSPSTTHHPSAPPPSSNHSKPHPPPPLPSPVVSPASPPSVNHSKPHLSPPPKPPPATISPASAPAASAPPVPSSASPGSSIPPVFPPPSSNATGNRSPIDPAQVSALQSLGVRLRSNPCVSSQNILLCDNASPLRHLIALQLQFCPKDALLTTDALAKLDTLQALSFLECPMLPVHVPPKLVMSLTSFSCIASLGMTSDRQDAPGLPGTWLSKFYNLTEIIVTDVKVNVSGLNVILTGMKHVKEIKFSRTNITGLLPVNTWPPNVTSLDLSGNLLHGTIPKTIGKLTLLQEMDLSGNQLTGRIPNVFGKMKKIQRLLLASNGLSGQIPDTVTSLSSLMYLDLSNNKLNGSIPEALNSMRALRYLDLSNNDFTGPLPFNKTFINKLNTLRLKGNSGICYDHLTLKSTLLVGIPKCDSSGLPILPTTQSSPSPTPDGASGPSGELVAVSSKHHRSGPKTIVAAVAITLVVIVVFIVIAVLVSRCRARKY